jgi:hypothetical protein|tara:strand:+ start:16529 stop:16642 length:114 start_codon:yes stop_codon:yes gene_type:complete
MGLKMRNKIVIALGLDRRDLLHPYAQHLALDDQPLND